MKEGVSQLFSFSPLKCFSIDSVLVDGKSVGRVSKYSFKGVNAAHTISVTFRKNKFTSSLAYSKNSSSGLIDSIKISSSSNKSFSMTATDGYLIEKVLLDGETADNFNSNNFSTVELIVVANESNKSLGKNSIESFDKSYQSLGKTIVEIDRLEDSDKGLTINCDALRYTASDDTDVTMVSSDLVWLAGEA